MRQKRMILSLYAVCVLPLTEITLAQCHPAPMTTIQMRICASETYRNVDRVLNNVYQKLLRLLDAEGRKKLIQSEQAWIRYRDTTCAFDVDSSRGGTIQPQLYTGCLTQLTEQRNQDLIRWLQERRQFQ